MDNIIVRGARSHNLKNINVSIPKNKIVVITGLSGSGKSSLAFDTIYAEGQRKYVESLSSYARQFLGIMEKADVDSITGLSPAISIDQKTTGHNPRSTVGTITEIYDYLRLLYARAGHPRNPKTGNRLQSQTVQEIVDAVLKLGSQENKKIMILAPVVKQRKGTYEELFRRFLAQGYLRARVDGGIFSLEEEIKLDRFKIHNIEIVVDRLQIKSDSKNDQDFLKRLTDSVEVALNLGARELIILDADSKAENFFSEKLVDTTTGESFPEIEPHTFSFNSPFGACPKCSGLGVIQEIYPENLYNPRLSISEGGIYPWARLADDPDSWNMQLIKAVGDVEGFNTRKPLSEMKPEHLNILFYGNGEKKYEVTYFSRSRRSMNTINISFEGLIPQLKRRFQETDSDYIRHEIEQYMLEISCPECHGQRLSPYALAVTINSKNINAVTALPLNQLTPWLESLKLVNQSNDPDTLSQQEKTIVKQVVKEIETRLNFLLAVGLEYLSLNRKARTLSGGEAQRIRLASQIGTGLSGVLYVLDEPSIGLHQRDNQRLIDTLNNLKNLGNSILVVEHDQDTIMQADYLIDMGPGAGIHGGEIVAEGTPQEICKDPKSLTGAYLSGRKIISFENIRQEVEKIVGEEPIKINNHPGELILKGATLNNLKNVDLKIPLGKFVVITGVSGSGKSSLINETLAVALRQKLNRAKESAGSFTALEGLENLDKVIVIDQSPIGRTPRSNPATYTGIFTKIREMYASTRESKARGYKSGRFSFNVRGGRCEACQGNGLIRIEMQFLPDVYVECEACHGKRFNRETLQIDYKGKNISEILDTTVEDAIPFFESIYAINNKLATLDQVGLGYIKLGQGATTFSGGEAQRIKLAAELSKRGTGKTIYILDEPTTGLHFEDLNKLLVVLHSLVAKGNTVVVIEHNLDLIKTADWIIDLGPEGGEKGGEIIYEGTVKGIVDCKRSYTGEWLAKL
ncbi:MAG: excinuclease ABC subunit UvrA [bacterium]